MDKINTIVCCCGQGLGSSMIMEMNVSKALKELGHENIRVKHIPLSEASIHRAEAYVCGLDVAYQLRDYPRVIVLKNIIMMDELTEKLKKMFEMDIDTFHIE